LTPGDIFATSAHLNRRSLKGAAIAVVVTLAAVVVAVAVMGAVVNGLGSDTGALIADALLSLVTGGAQAGTYLLLVVVLAAAVRSHVIAAAAHAVAFRRGPLANVEVTTRVESDGLYVETADVQSRVVWESFQRIDEAPVRTFLVFTGPQALLVPRRAFADEAQYRAAVALVRDRVAAAKDFART
jgi:hypothetical protein